MINNENDPSRAYWKDAVLKSNNYIPVLNKIFLAVLGGAGLIGFLISLISLYINKNNDGLHGTLNALACLICALAAMSVHIISVNTTTLPDEHDATDHRTLKKITNIFQMETLAIYTAIFGGISAIIIGLMEKFTTTLNTWTYSLSIGLLVTTLLMTLMLAIRRYRIHTSV